MALEDCRNDMEMCHRCSACKFMPLERVRGYEHVNTCPSIARYNFHAYSGGGRLASGLALLDGRFELTDGFRDIVYACQMCGACDVSCKYGMDMEVLEPISEVRAWCAETGHSPPELDRVVEMMMAQGTMIAPESVRRGEWAEGLEVKNVSRDKAQVIYFAGCRTAFNKEMWTVARSAVSLFAKAGIDVAVAGDSESCCGGRAYHMGYRDAFEKQATITMELFKRSAVRTVVTACAECYHTFKVLYERIGVREDLEVLHSSEFLDRLVTEGKLKPSRRIDAKVTYHDPCHLGRLGEPHIKWEGERIPGHMYRFDPPKPYRRGTNGVYEAPRHLLKSIPGIEVVEMDRTREYAWCCGSGGGVKEANPEFARWTGRERIEEAESTGAGILVTACPGCEKNFRDVLEAGKSSLRVVDIVELLAQTL
jgi:Fe-S oxidoreductase